MLNRDRYEPKRVAVEVVGTLDPNRHSQMDILSGGGISQTVDTLKEVKKVAVELSSSDGEHPTVTTNKGDGSKVAIPVITPDRAVKKQNGKRFKEDGEPEYTLTSQDLHGVAQDVAEGTGGGDEHPPIYVELANGHKAYCIWYPKKQCYITIRRLTPKEYFRLQGWTDDYFEKAQFVNSDSQLYKQAGNGVTVQVVQAIGKKLKEIEEEE